MKMLEFRIAEEGTEVLAEYGGVPIAFTVKSILEVRVIDRGLGGLVLTERPIARPYVKDYDAIEGEGPVRWGRRWDIANWQVLSAFSDQTRVGGCVIAFDTLGVEKLEGRKDVAALWDLRVAPELRGRGIGSALIESAAAWSLRHGCKTFKAETQNINVPACRFYARHGFALGAVNRFAYAEFPDEIELVWYKML
jgi:GNAT superfamily N-acetyltransferase